jgi:hypothetical protein
MTDSSFDYLIPIWASIFTVYLILFSDMTFIESIFSGLIVGGILLIVAPFVRSYIEQKREDKKRHKNRLWKEIIVKLQNLSRPTYSEFSIALDNTGQENTDEYKWTFQHFRDKHTNITKNYDSLIEHTNNLNDESLKDLKRYIDDKIKNAIGKKYTSKLNKIISDIIFSIFKKKIYGLKDIKFKIIKSKNQIYVSPDEYWGISPKEKEFLSELIKNKDFRLKMKNIQEESDLLNESFDKFKTNIKELIHKIERNGISELKGSCDECP